MDPCHSSTATAFSSCMTSSSGTCPSSMKHVYAFSYPERGTRSVKWDKIACCCPPNIDTFDSRDCAKLGALQSALELDDTTHTTTGIPITHKPHPDVTHHLTPTYSLTPTIATSLLSAAHLVKPSWLTDLIDYYSPLESDDASTKEYHLPAISKHRPTHSPALPSSLKNHRSWEPNEARVGMFKGHRVIFVGERGREASEEYKELVKRGEGTYECCAVQGGRKPLHDVLAKAVGKDAKIVLIADQAAMVAAVGQDSWNEMTEEAARSVLHRLPSNYQGEQHELTPVAVISYASSPPRSWWWRWLRLT